MADIKKVLTDDGILRIYKANNWFIFEPDLHRAKVITKAQRDLTNQQWIEWLEDTMYEVNQRACSLGDIPVVLIHKEKLQALKSAIKEKDA